MMDHHNQIKHSKLGQKTCPLLAIWLVLLVVALPACASTTSVVRRPSVTPTSTPLPTAFPAFPDWRMAYLAHDGHLHAVSLDGKTDVIGPELPYLYPANIEFTSAGISSDGHFLAYTCYAATFVRLQATVPGDQNITGKGTPLFWSLDGTRLALTGGRDGIDILTTSNPKISAAQPIPHMNGSNTPWLLGWLDATHLLIDDPDLSSGTAFGYPLLESLDITTGARRTIVKLVGRGLSEMAFVISPDGSQILVWNRPFQDEPYTPYLALIATANGQIRPLPHIRQTVEPYEGIWFSTFAWQPGTNILAASTGYDRDNDLHSWLIDLNHDTAQPFQAGRYMEGWSPDGQTLITGSDESTIVGHGPHDLAAVTFPATGTPVMTPLTHDVWTFSYLGFVRTAP